NLDLVYGLPRQSVESVARTIRKALALAPDRIAIFGYAHLPQRFRHQRLIDEAQMPDAADRFAQSRALHGALHEAGYAQVGLDHFARPGDALAGPNVARNFQGYTTDQSDALIGLGASAISRLPQGFSQNAVPVDDYGRRIAAGDFATVRGHAMTADDHLRAFIIERLMCDFTLSWHEVERRFGAGAATVREDARRLIGHDRDGFIVADRDGFTVTPEGRPFVRTICAGFDAYLAAEHTERRHALAV
ncbi:MAG: coproporphyrinogen III oxidase, partial [Hyphomicrobium sp.]